MASGYLHNRTQEWSHNCTAEYQSFILPGEHNEAGVSKN
jgi:hypothetical protein